MLSSVIIYCTKDKTDLQRCIKSLPSWSEIIICETIPTETEKWDIYQVGEYGNIKRYNLHYPKGEFRFDNARNIAKTKATQEWVLSIDADERLVKDDEQWLYELLKNTPDDVGAYYSTQINYSDVILEENGLSGRVPTPAIRLFRNIPPIKFHYPVHEIIFTSDVIQSGYKILDTQHVILHYESYSGDRAKVITKMKRNLEIILKHWNEFQDPISKARYYNYIKNTILTFEHIGGEIEWE